MTTSSIALRRRAMVGACAMGIVLAAMPGQMAHAQAYPAKPIRLVVPFPPGGGADRVARILTRKLEQTMKANFIIENRGGANGNIALDLVAKSPADGYTLALTLTDHLALNTSLFDKLSYDPVKDFAPVSLIASYPFVLAVDAASGPTSMVLAVAAAKAAPASMTIGFPSANARLAIEQLQRRASIKLNVVPYRGIAQGMPDVIGGRLTFWIGTSATLRGHIDGGKVRGLAVTAPKRLPAMPGIPTVAELGYPGFETVSWYGLLAPARTPPAVVAALNTHINAALSDAEVRAAFEADGATLLGGTPERFSEVLQADSNRLGALARELKLKTD